MEKPESPQDILFERRKLFLFGEITDESVHKIIQQLIALNDSDEDVYLYICSDGGYVSSGLALIDVMKSMNYDIHTIVVGEVASMAAIIACCGTIGKRWVHKHGRIMFHSPYTDGVGGKSKEIKVYLKEFERSETILNRIIAKQTGHSFEKVKKDFDKSDFWLGPQAAIKYRAVDGNWTKAREHRSNRGNINGIKRKKRKR